MLKVLRDERHHVIASCKGASDSHHHPVWKGINPQNSLGKDRCLPEMLPVCETAALALEWTEPEVAPILRECTERVKAVRLHRGTFTGTLIQLHFVLLPLTPAKC